MQDTDLSPTACRVIAERLRGVCIMKEGEPRWKTHQADAFVVHDLPWKVTKLRTPLPFEFEDRAVIALGGIPNKAQAGDRPDIDASEAVMEREGGSQGRFFVSSATPSPA